MEILIVLGIFAVLAAASFPLYSNMQVQSARQSAVDDVADTLRLSVAQFRADGGPRGVLFEPHAVTSYTGESYVSRTVELDRRIEFGEVISLSTTFSGNEFHTGSTDMQFPSGSITVNDSITGKQEIIRLTSLGVVLYGQE
jgi:type II secretory pathway pseudopilin PulG